MSFEQNFLSITIVAIIWFSFALFVILCYYLFPSEIYYWDKVLEKCTKKSAKYRYIIRFIFGSFKKDFQLSKTTITIEVLNSRDSLSVITISPKQLEQSLPKFDSSNLMVCRFLLYRLEPLLDILSIIVNHNGLSSINVTTIEIQEIHSSEANIAYVGQPINGLTKEKASVTQRFPSATKESRSIESGLNPSKTLSAIEFIILLFLAINLMLLLCLLIIPCNEKSLKLCNDYSNGFLSSLLAGLTASTIAALLFVFLCLFYRYIFKNMLYKYKGNSVLTVIRYGFFIFIIINGLIMGGLAAFKASNNRQLPSDNKTQEYNHQIYWMFGIGIAMAVFFLFWMSILSTIAYLIGFFSEPKEQTVNLVAGTEVIDKTSRTDTEEEDNNSDYYNSIMKGNLKVKSISQYAGIRSQQSTQSSKTTAEPSPSVTKIKSKSSVGPKESQKTLRTQNVSDTTQKVSKTASTESTGSGYFQQLMKGQGKVRSVSQYQGV